jgi:hypothetical protein
MVEVLFQEQRDTEAAVVFFRSALENTGVTPHTVTTDQAAAYPPAPAQVLPEVEPIRGKAEQQSIERDHQHLKGRLKIFRGCKTTGEPSGSAKPMAGADSTTVIIPAQPNKTSVLTTADWSIFAPKFRGFDLYSGNPCINLDLYTIIYLLECPVVKGVITGILGFYTSMPNT